MDELAWGLHHKNTNAFLANKSTCASVAMVIKFRHASQNSDLTF